MANIIGGINRAISNLLARAVVRGTNSANKCQMLEASMIDDEFKNNIEHLEPYGFTSAPLAGAEAVIANFDGDKSHGVVLVVADRRYRIKGLKSGEVAIYTDEGSSITLRRGRIIEINADDLIVNASNKITFNTPEFKVPNGNISDSVSSVQKIRDIFNSHNHVDSQGGNTKQPNQGMN